MATTTAQLIEFLSEFPADTLVLIAGTNPEKNQDIRSYHTSRDANDNLLAPVVLSASMYTANETF